MKIRAGFVSNSSSSSYTIILSKDDHEKIKDTWSEEEKRWFWAFEDGYIKEVIINNFYLVVSAFRARDDRPSCLEREEVEDIVYKWVDQVSKLPSKLVWYESY